MTTDRAALVSALDAAQTLCAATGAVLVHADTARDTVRAHHAALGARDLARINLEIFDLQQKRKTAA